MPSNLIHREPPPADPIREAPPREGDGAFPSRRPRHLPTPHPGIVAVSPQVYDLSGATIVEAQRIQRAHRNAITALCGYAGGIVSGDVDGNIQHWAPSTTPGSVLAPKPSHSHPNKANASHTIWELAVTRDATGAPVLLACYDRWDPALLALPDLSRRGLLVGVQGPRTISCVPDLGIMACGGKEGQIKVWQWLQPGEAPQQVGGPGGYQGAPAQGGYHGGAPQGGYNGGVVPGGYYGGGY